MGNPNESTSSSKSVTKPSRPDEPKWHPGRKLCYHWKREHVYLQEKVHDKDISYNTEFDLDIEHCEVEERDKCMSLRPSKHDSDHKPVEKNKNGEVYNRYKKLYEDFQSLVDQNLVTTDDGEPMWKFKVEANNKRRTLFPRNEEESKRKPRLGSFEVILSWRSAGVDQSRREVVLFSKLNTLKFPNPPDVIAYIKRILASARMLAFRVHVHRVTDGQPYSGAIAEVKFGDSEEDSVHNTTDRKGVVDLRLPFGKDFQVIASGKQEESVKMTGLVTFDVHGELPSSICMPLVPTHTHGEIRVVLTWGEFPHDVVLKVKTPEGAIQTPDQGLLQSEDKDLLVGKEKLPNASFEFRPSEGGFGPISVLLRTLIPGRYHIYARCKPYPFAGRRLGWPDSNAQIHIYGHEQESLQWKGAHRFKCKKIAGDQGKFWNVCFFEVSKTGAVTVSTEFNSYVEEEPGFRECVIICKDLQGKLVPNASVECKSKSEAYQTMGPFAGSTGLDGSIRMNLPMGEYTVKVSREDYLPSGAEVLVDLEPHSAQVTIAMVKPEYFAGSNNKLVVLSWSGEGKAMLHVETPGRLFEYPEAGDEDKSYSIAPSTSMKMRGNNPRGCMLTIPDPTVCVWSDPTKQDPSADYSDQIFVEYDGIMEHANVQVNIFSKEGILYSAVPPASQGPCRYWRVCKIQGDNIFSTNERVVDDPASGDIFSIRALLAKVHQHEDGEEATLPLSPELKITKHGDNMPVRTYLEALERDSAEFTKPLEYKLFMPFGTYKIEAKDERWIMRLATEKNPEQNQQYDSLLFDRRTYNAMGFCFASQEDLDAKSILISLTWGNKPKDLDLCLAHADGVVTSQNRSDTPGAHGSVPKGVSYVTSHSDGYGPNVISITQPVSAKFRVYVMNRSKQDPKAFLKCFPMVNIMFYNQIWRSFTIKVPNISDALDSKQEAGKGLSCCWHVCDLRIEQDTKMGEQCIECVEINELLDAELKTEAKEPH